MKLNKIHKNQNKIFIGSPSREAWIWVGQLKLWQFPCVSVFKVFTSVIILRNAGSNQQFSALVLPSKLDWLPFPYIYDFMMSMSLKPKYEYNLC